MKEILFIFALFLISTFSFSQKIIGHYGSIEVRLCQPFSVVEFIFFDNGTFERKRYNEYVTKGEYKKNGDTLYITKGQAPKNDHQSISSTYLIVGDTCILDLDYYYDYFIVDKRNLLAFKNGEFESCDPYRVFTKCRPIKFPQKKATSKREIEEVKEILSIIIKSDIFSKALDSMVIPIENYFEINEENINIALPNRKVKFIPPDEIDWLEDIYFSFYYFNRLANNDYRILVRLNDFSSYENPLLYFQVSEIRNEWTIISKRSE